MNGKDILALPMQDNDACADTIKEYLVALLRTLWEEGESFSGKRPFGNSGWDGELIVALVGGGAVEGKLDQDGYLDSYNDAQVDLAIRTAIDALLTKN